MPTTTSAEFVYSCAFDEGGRAYLRRDRIFKRTGTRVYATRAPGRGDGGAGDSLTRTFVLDGRALASAEGAWSRVTRTRYFARAEFALAPIRAQGPSAAFIALGLTAEADLLAIRRAYHRLALACHPDRGGDAATFRLLHQHYEQACREVAG